MENISLEEKDLKYIWHPCSQMKDYENLPPIIIDKGKGIYLYDIYGNIYGTFESLDKRFSITLSEPIRKNDDYNFASSVSELNNEINYHIMMEDDVEAKNREGGYSEYDNPEWGSPYVYCSNYDNERYSSFDRIIFCYGSGGTEYQLYINIIDENTLILLEAGSIHKGKYGLNGVFKRKK